MNEEQEERHQEIELKQGEGRRALDYAWRRACKNSSIRFDDEQRDWDLVESEIKKLEDYAEELENQCRLLLKRIRGEEPVNQLSTHDQSQMPLVRHLYRHENRWVVCWSKTNGEPHQTNEVQYVADVCDLLYREVLSDENLERVEILSPMNR